MRPYLFMILAAHFDLQIIFNNILFLQFLVPFMYIFYITKFNTFIPMTQKETKIQ